jgi:hypothetical protein
VWLDKPPATFENQKIFDPSFGKTYFGLGKGKGNFQDGALSALFSVGLTQPGNLASRTMFISPLANQKFDVLKFLDQK